MHKQLTVINNYHEFDEGLATAGQPTAEQFALIREAGFEIVNNLAQNNSPGALPDEAEVINGEKMQYLHIPVDFREPQMDNLEDFFVAMNEHENKKRFVHCACNWRVSAFMFLYRTKVLGLDRTQAKRDLYSVWTPDAVWSDFIRRAEKPDSGVSS